MNSNQIVKTEMLIALIFIIMFLIELYKVCTCLASILTELFLSLCSGSAAVVTGRHYSLV